MRLICAHHFAACHYVDYVFTVLINDLNSICLPAKFNRSSFSDVSPKILLRMLNDFIKETYKPNNRNDKLKING